MTWLVEEGVKLGCVFGIAAVVASLGFGLAYLILCGLVHVGYRLLPRKRG